MQLIEVDGEILSILENMAETMYAAPGIGLAAIQVGITKKIGCYRLRA